MFLKNEIFIIISIKKEKTKHEKYGDCKKVNKTMNFLNQ